MVWDVACLGDLVIDMVPQQLADGHWLYAPHPGGAPGNVAVGLARLGARAIMLAKLGDEAFGRMIASALQSHGVDPSGLSFVAGHNTRLSVVTLDPGGEREFIFYGDDPADLQVAADDIDPKVIEGSSILHLGGLLLAGPISAMAQAKAIALARGAGRLISADPNFRPALWADHAAMQAAGRQLVAAADIVKLSEDELLALAPDHDSLEAAARSLWHGGLKVMAVTSGARGAHLLTADHRLVHGGFRVDAIDTTAAGDAFMASLLRGLLDIRMDLGEKEALQALLRACCAAGALAATKKGAMASLPDSRAIAGMLKTGCENPVVL